VAFMALLAVQGCSRGLRVHTMPPGSESLRPAIGQPASRARIETVTVFLNGTETPASQDFVATVENKLRETRLFSQVSRELPEGADVVDLRLTAHEVVNAHLGANATKGFFIGLTFFALTPVLPLSVDRSLDLTLEATSPTGEVRRYSSRATGDLSITIFGNAQVAGAKLAGQVTTEAINGLMNQMVNHAAFFAVKGAGPERAEKPASPRPPTPPAAMVDTRDDPATRLRKLDGMRQQGLLSDDEYQAKRQQILDEL